jgi:DNA repair exonuclease SbcCD ATPase subunit
MNGLSSKDRADLYERLAAANRRSLDVAGVTAFTIAGPAGSGKSSIIESLLLRLSPPL